MAKSTVRRGPKTASLRSQWVRTRRPADGDFADSALTSIFHGRREALRAENWLCEIVVDAGTQLSPLPQFQQGRCANSAQSAIKTQEIPPSRAAVLAPRGGQVGGSSK